MKVKNRKKNARKAFVYKKPFECPNCLSMITEGHFVGASLGEEGFWICDAELKTLKD